MRTLPILALVAAATLSGCAPRRAVQPVPHVVTDDPAEALYGDWQVVARVGRADLSYLPRGCALGDVVFRRDHSFTIYEFDVPLSGYFVAIRDGDALDVTLQPQSFVDGLNCMGNPAAASRPLANRRTMRFRADNAGLIRRHGQNWSDHIRLAPRTDAPPPRPVAAPAPEPVADLAPVSPPVTAEAPDGARLGAADSTSCAFRLVDPTTVTVEGRSFHMPGPGSFEDDAFRFLHVLLVGYGRFVVSDEPFDGAEHAGSFVGPRLSAVVGGRPFTIQASAQVFDCPRAVDAFVRFDPLPDAYRLPLDDVGLTIGLSHTIRAFGPAFQAREAQSRRDALGARRNSPPPPPARRP